MRDQKRPFGIRLAIYPDYFAQVLVGYQESVIQDDARANRFIEEKPKDISCRCRQLPRTEGRSLQGGTQAGLTRGPE